MSYTGPLVDPGASGPWVQEAELLCSACGFNHVRIVSVQTWPIVRPGPLPPLEVRFKLSCEGCGALGSIAFVFHKGKTHLVREPHERL